MHAVGFLSPGLPEALVVGGLVVVLFAPGAARLLGGLARDVLKLKRDIEGTKEGFRRRIEDEVDAVVGKPRKTTEKKERHDA
ncbi:MAG: hypothetical protein ACLF0G_05135 [Candidatus Brocadiia bacterium]